MAAAALNVAPSAWAEEPTDVAAESAFDPTDHYQEREIEGWPVLVNRRLAEHDSALTDETMRLLGEQLYQVRRVVPEAALAELRKIPIWVELADKRFPCMCYHPSRGWLTENGYNPAKEGAVELANARNFLAWTKQQPWMVLHELAHGYHDRVLGYDHAEVRAAYDRAREAGVYESVLNISGRDVRAYAMNNDREYFAEASEAYFGTNDFYPFVRAEFKRHDPTGYAALEAAWRIAE